MGSRTIIQLLDSELGPPLPFNERAECPKCGGLEHNLQRQYCPGFNELHPQADEMPCRVHGQHLHVVCAGCSYTWREWCKDHVEEGPESKIIAG